MLEEISSVLENKPITEIPTIENDYTALLAKINKGTLITADDYLREIGDFQASLNKSNLTPIMRHAMLTAVMATAITNSQDFKSFDKVASTKPNFQEYLRFLNEIVTTPPNSVNPGWRWGIGRGTPLRGGLYTGAINTKSNPNEVLSSTPVQSTVKK